MMFVRFTPLLFALSICLSAQPGAVPREAGPAAGSGGGAAENLSQGQSDASKVVSPIKTTIVRDIRKRNTRYLVVYPEGLYSPRDLDSIRRSVEQLSDVIADGARLTKADAARSGAGGATPEALADELQRRLQTSGVAAVALNALPGGETAKQIPCPPPNCGCKEDGGPGNGSCVCGLLKNEIGEFCMCFLCWPYPKLQPFPENDPVFSGLRTANPGAGSPPEKPAYVIVVAAKPDASPALRKQLLDTGIKTLQSEPWPAGVTIKTKSSPRYSSE